MNPSKLQDRPAIVIAAHGERGGAGDDARLTAFVESVGRLIPHADVSSVLINQEGMVGACLDAIGERPTVVTPLLFSDGFFFRERLRPVVTGPNQRLADVLAFWPEFAVFLADNLAHQLVAQLADPRVVLVAHGARSSSASAEAARRVAARLQGRFGQVETGFLEEAPFAADVVRDVAPPFALVGLFFGAGLHGADDFGRLAAEAPNRPLVSFTIGELPGLVDLVARKALQELAKLEAS